MLLWLLIQDERNKYHIPNLNQLLKHRQCQKQLILVKRKRNWTVLWSKVLVSESRFYISLVNQGPRICRTSEEAYNPRCLKVQGDISNF